VFRSRAVSLALVVPILGLLLTGCDEGTTGPRPNTTLRIAGTVTWWDCRPVPGVTVVLYDFSCQSFSECTEEVYGSGITDIDGRFEFEGSSRCYAHGPLLQARADSGVVRLASAERVECRSELQEFALVMGTMGRPCTPQD
jgi:hypothetical protein